MRFTLIDRIVSITDNKKIKAIKNLSLSEEYLMDHFPGNPVMPGVLMLEAMVQTGGWLVRILKDFDVSVVFLKEARNIRYSRFITPGDQLQMDMELLELGDDTAQFKGVGYHNGKAIVNGRLKLGFFNVKSLDEKCDINDRVIQNWARDKFKILYRGQVS